MHEMFDRVHQPDGGFTYQPLAHDSLTEGYALSIHPERSAAFDASSLKLKDLTKYVAKNKDLLKDKDNYIGAWHDPASNFKIFLLRHCPR